MKIKHTPTFFFVLTLMGAITAARAEIAAGEARALTPALAKANQRWPALAAGKESYLAVWQEGDMMDGVKRVAIMAARIDADGNSLDPRGIAVCDLDDLRGYPAVTFDGTGWVVAWQDYRNRKDWDLYAARITTDGVVKDPDGFAVLAGEGNQVYPTLASDGRGAAFVGWSDVRPGFQPELYRIHAAFLRDGKASPDFEVSKSGASLLDPRVAWDGEDYVMGAIDGSPGHGNGRPRTYRISPAGAARNWKISPFTTSSFAIAADPAGKRTCIVSSSAYGHGGYHVGYVVNVARGAEGPGLRHALLGLQDEYPPRNELWGAVTFDGRQFVMAVEQSDLLSKGRQPDVTVWFAVARVDPATGKTLDLPCAPWEGLATDMRQPTGSKEYKEAVEKGKTQNGLRVGYEKGIQLRHPAMASLGDGKSLLVYSRHGGVENYYIHAALLRE